MCCDCGSVRRAFLNFRLKSCCFVASVKLGLNVIAYFKILMSAMSLLSEARFSPIANGVQGLVSSAEGGTAVPRLANITVILFNVLLVIAVNKKISVLLQVFIYYSLAKIGLMAIVLWPIVNANEDSALRFIVITAFSIVFQLYVILLVRSVIVEINEDIAESNGKAPVQIIYTSNKETETGQAGEATVEIQLPKPNEESSKEEEITEYTEKLPKEVVVEVKQDRS